MTFNNGNPCFTLSNIGNPMQLIWQVQAPKIGIFAVLLLVKRIT